jgi:hypothetical protein
MYFIFSLALIFSLISNINPLINWKNDQVSLSFKKNCGGRQTTCKSLPFCLPSNHFAMYLHPLSSSSQLSVHGTKCIVEIYSVYLSDLCEVRLHAFGNFPFILHF